MSVESEADLFLALVASITDNDETGSVDKVEQIHDLFTSPAAAWLGGKTPAEAFAENPYYVLFLAQPDNPGCYLNEMGSSNLADVSARARLEIMRGAKSAYVTQVVEIIP